MNELKITRRVTTTFLSAIPPQVEHFDAFIYAVVKRKPGKDLNTKWGTDVRLDPCEFDWERKTITIHIPFNINDGIESVDDLSPTFFEEIEAAFLTLMWACFP